MIDVSDGLLADLGHIIDLSHVGARLYLEQLPLSVCYREKRSSVAEDDPYLLPLSGGEDYELLFTAHPDTAHMVDAVMAETGTRITTIGEITDSGRLSVLTSRGTEYPVVRKGYNHFPS
jgi:thiamine-monophosphate kinase